MVYGESVGRHLAPAVGAPLTQRSARRRSLGSGVRSLQQGFVRSDDPATTAQPQQPQPKKQVDEVEANAKRLKDRCSALLSGAKRYRDAIGAMLDAQTAFARAVGDFGGGDDEESLHLGSAVMAPFVKAMRELGGTYEFLRTQLELGLIDRLQREWVDGALAAQRDERRRYDRRAAEYEAAR